MKPYLLLLFLSISITFFAQDRTIDEQLLLKYDQNYITQVKEVSPKRYEFYVMELLRSYEFVDLEDGKNYPELEAFDFHTNMPKEAPIFINFKTFSLYDYKVERHPTDDIIYRIPNSVSPNKGLKLYSKVTLQNQ